MHTVTVGKIPIPQSGRVWPGPDYYLNMKNVAVSARHVAKLCRIGALQRVGVAFLDHQITMLEERCAQLRRKRLVHTPHAPRRA